MPFKISSLCLDWFFSSSSLCLSLSVFLLVEKINELIFGLDNTRQTSVPLRLTRPWHWKFQTFQTLRWRVSSCYRRFQRINIMKCWWMVLDYGAVVTREMHNYETNLLFCLLKFKRLTLKGHDRCWFFILLYCELWIKRKFLGQPSIPPLLV